MVGFVFRAVIAALGLWLATRWIGGISIDSAATLVLAGVLLGVVNAIVRPIAVVLTFPLTLLTLGLFLLIVNAAMLGLRPRGAPYTPRLERIPVRSSGRSALTADRFFSIIPAPCSRQSGRHREDVGDVVEAVAGVVRRQQRRAVDLDDEQVPNGVRVLGAIQTVHG
jgi:hypothetical protein